MNDDGVQSHAVEEVEREGEGFQLVSEDRSSDLEHGEMGGRGEDLEVARDFTTGGQRVE